MIEVIDQQGHDDASFVASQELGLAQGIGEPARERCRQSAGLRFELGARLLIAGHRALKEAMNQAREQLVEGRPHLVDQRLELGELGGGRGGMQTIAGGR